MTPLTEGHLFNIVYLNLLYGDFGAADGFAGEAANLANLEGYNTFAGSVDGEVAGHLSTFAGALGQADLADDNLAGSGFLATRQLNTEPLARAVLVDSGATA